MLRRSLTPAIFLAVPMTVLLVFVLIPTVGGLLASMCDWDGTGTPSFVGFANFRSLWSDPAFIPAVRNTLVFTAITVPAQIALGFLLAACVNARWFRGRSFVRTAFFLPTIVSIITIGFVWRWFLDSTGGLLPSALRAMGVPTPDFLQGGAMLPAWTGVGEGLTWPLFSIACIQVWRMLGFCMVLYLAALQSVPESLTEAAEIDGAGRWRTLHAVTWPGVAPMTSFLAVTGVIGSLQVFDIVWALTSQGESDRTRVLNTMIFREFQQGRMGFASALGVVIFALTLSVTLAPRLLRARSAIHGGE